MRIAFYNIALCFVIVIAGCEKQEEALHPKTPEVAYIPVKYEKVLITTRLPGRTHAYLVAEVRPRVGGIIQKRFFEEGADVKEGQILYEISSATYKALSDKCKASLARSEARAVALKYKYERNKNLYKTKAVSKQDYETSESAYLAAKAEIEACKAELETSDIKLGYTQILAPISGRIGKSDITIGSLVTANDPVPLARIQQIDPIFVNAVQSSIDLLKNKREVESGYIQKNDNKIVKVKLYFEDNSLYDLEGELKFRDITVDQSTGSFILRIVFPNPKGTLMPGMYVSVVIEDGTVNNGILVPHQAVKRNFKGEPIAYIVDALGKVEERKLIIVRSMEDKWLVRDGLKEGDKLIVEGFQWIRPGMSVTAVPFNFQNENHLVANTKETSKE
ncbi:MAG: hypothetical protein A2X47_01235 [Lentisphaerae bacterium GWF2_38_69]|nr:MAG: hypothetical protein A2X47_01235 [Lentisphaerae bacterium GWF2_38_69]